MDGSEADLIMEIAEGIHRIESDLDERFMCQYGVAGRDRAVLDKLIPPRYYDLQAPRLTIARLDALRPELLLTAHYPVLDRVEALEWLSTGRAFVDDVERVVRSAPAEKGADLWALTRRVDGALGPYPQLMTELGATVRETTH
jgi:hypothetical protein